ncbi:2'-5' RNA ligase family protein [Streptomyces sp. NPDC051051]|uniref:2'-5' RNA ligase family protein n=1 Tax=Streptomyces sp. NPDC051051 TaxID=3155666 RepID=UPI003442A954
MHTVELLPDPATEGAVQDVWRRLLGLGLPSQATHRHPTNRPHLTLATADALTSEVRGWLRRELAVLPIPLHLEGLVRFTGRTRVLAWAVRPDDVLLRLHETVWRTLRDAPESGRLNPLHDPARWIPHITLGRGRDAVGRDPQDDLFQETAAPAGVLAGRWEAARHYDSLTRTTDRIGF